MVCRGRDGKASLTGYSPSRLFARLVTVQSTGGTAEPVYQAIVGSVRFWATGDADVKDLDEEEAKIKHTGT